MLPCGPTVSGPSYDRGVPVDPQSSIVDVVMGLAALATLVTIVRARRTFLDRDLSAADKRLATQAAVFLVPPIVVLIHELGHVGAVASVGARVVSFRYGFFEGAVGVAGDLSQVQAWWVSLSGNLAGALTGLALAGAGMAWDRLRPGPRYVLILGGTLQVGYALIGYPLLSLSTDWGDWVTIYDFGATPGLSWATAVVHAAVLAVLWRWWRGTVRHTLFAVASGAGDRVAALRASVRANPADEAGWLDLARLYAGFGELGLARSTLEEAAGAAPTARVHLARARVAIDGVQVVVGGHGGRGGGEGGRPRRRGRGPAAVGQPGAGPGLDGAPDPCPGRLRPVGATGGRRHPGPLRAGTGPPGGR